MTIVELGKWFQALPGVRFVALSGFSFLVNFGTTVFLHEVLRVPAQFAFAIALVAAIVTSFLGMRYFVCPGQQRGIGRQFVLFVASSSGFRFFEYLTFVILHIGIGFPYRPVVVTTLCASLMVKYPFYKARVFN